MPARRPPAAARDGSGRRAARRGEAGGGGGGAAPPHTSPRGAFKRHTRPQQRGRQNRAGDAGPGPVRDPPPTRWGEARAAVGRRASLGALAARSGGAPLAGQTDTRRRGAAAGGCGTPRHPLRIAREGFLTEGGIAPDPEHSPVGQQPERSDAGAWGWGSAARVEEDGRRPPRMEASGGSTARTTTRGRKTPSSTSSVSAPHIPHGQPPAGNSPARAATAARATASPTAWGGGTRHGARPSRAPNARREQGAHDEAPGPLPASGERRDASFPPSTLPTRPPHTHLNGVDPTGPPGAGNDATDSASGT